VYQFFSTLYAQLIGKEYDANVLNHLPLRLLVAEASVDTTAE